MMLSTVVLKRSTFVSKLNAVYKQLPVYMENLEKLRDDRFYSQGDLPLSAAIIARFAVENSQDTVQLIKEMAQQCPSHGSAVELYNTFSKDSLRGILKRTAHLEVQSPRNRLALPKHTA